MMGEGRIFLESEDEVSIKPISIPSHWARLNGLDFGIDHPFGFASIAYDRDRDIIYVIKTHKQKNAKPAQQAAIIKNEGQWIPVSWPHDGVNREKGSGTELHKLYRRENLNMLSRSARYSNDKGGSQPQWPVIEEIKERERTGRFKVFNTCVDYLEERRNYHTKDNKIVAKRDDCLKAAFYAVMMRRFATTQGSHRRAMPTKSVMSTRI